MQTSLMAEKMSSRVAQPEHGHSTKVRKAAQDFEAVLLASLLESMQETVSILPGESKKSSSDNYSYMGTQALAAQLAASGGLGIAKMIIGQLARTEVTSEPTSGYSIHASSRS